MVRIFLQTKQNYLGFIILLRHGNGCVSGSSAVVGDIASPPLQRKTFTDYFLNSLGKTRGEALCF